MQMLNRDSFDATIYTYESATHSNEKKAVGLRVTATTASVEHHVVQPTDCMDIEPEPSCGIPS